MNCLCFSIQVLKATLPTVPWAGAPCWDEAFPFRTASIGGIGEFR